MKIKKVALGYWYQRTSLHLAEVNDFLLGEPSPLDLNQDKLKDLRNSLRIESIKTDVDVLERLDIVFDNGISGRIYEDGLVLISKKHVELNSDIEALNRFFEDRFLPAVNYLFSLGAPVPKELAGVSTPTPIFIVTDNATQEEARHILTPLQPFFSEISDKNVHILKGGKYYLINILGDFDKDEHLLESLIFFKEFKAQLHHYLNLHRVLWEKIEDIKEKGSIKGKEVTPMRSQLEGYKKTVELIGGRIEQMNLYIPTRAAIVNKNGWEKFLTGVLEFQYDNLDHNLAYIKSIWGMTTAFLDSAIQIFTEVSSLSTRDSVNALTIISSIGVISGVLGFLTADKLPSVTHNGIVYFGLLLLGTIVVNRALRYIFQHVRYKINDIKFVKITSDRHI
ncbi:MAG TPA: hypothetical protein VFJ84_02865 [Candidatus Saccharimonadales bacterium]|nr:hypothetical protein [Candidatus Saccharimonadales bacterium]